MSERKWTWIVLAILLALAALSGCATPTQVAKPSIPDDLRLVCYQGVIAVMSESAEEAMVSNVPCDVEKI
ncbi:MAG: hypothetical protein J5J04_17260 [Anaerolineae bacterium]|nr:hypothetical protein [Anaerolineae bacterium]